MTAERDALAELVACKDLYERWGAINPCEPGCEKEALRDEWRKREPAAWAAARAVLAAQPDPEPNVTMPTGRPDCFPPDPTAAPAQEPLSEAIRYAINTNSAENASNTPDYILAQFLCACLAAFNTATQQRETWHGRDARPSLAAPAQEPQYCDHAWEYGQRHVGCILHCGLPQRPRTPVAAPAQGELQTEYQAGWDNCYAMAEPAIAALRAERDEAHSAVDAWIDLLRATEAERDALRAECADLRRRLDEHIDDKERALRLSAKESTRLTTEVERLRECVRVADKMRWSTRCQQYEWPTYDAARAKVQP